MAHLGAWFLRVTGFVICHFVDKILSFISEVPFLFFFFIEHVSLACVTSRDCLSLPHPQVGSSTNTLNALQIAFADEETQVIYLLTDGRPDQVLPQTGNEGGVEFPKRDRCGSGWVLSSSKAEKQILSQTCHLHIRGKLRQEDDQLNGCWL